MPSSEDTGADVAQMTSKEIHRRQLPRRQVLASGLGAMAATVLPTGAAAAAVRGSTDSSQSAANADYRIGTFYFTVWNPDLGTGLVTNGKKVYGSSDPLTPAWWNGPKQHLTEPGPWGYGPLPEREPVIGYYDDRNQTVIDQHILQAASRGIDHFSFYYYWKNGGGGERPGQEATHNFLASPYNDLMDFYLYVVSDGGWPPSDWNSLIVPKLVEYMRHSSYMTTSDGRPIIGFIGNFAKALGGETQLRAGLAFLRNAATAAGLGNPLLLENAYRTLAPSIANGYDGFLPLNLAGIGLTPQVIADYASSYPPAWESFVYNPGTGYENYENYLFIPGGLGAFDMRPWRGVAASDSPTGSFLTYVYADPSPAAFKAQLTKVKNYLDSHPRSMNMATFYCWNENGEGGVIEPSSLFGFGNLNAIQEIFGLSNATYKSKILSAGLPDLDPAVRIGIAPERAAIAAPESTGINVTVSNNSPNTLTLVQVCLDQAGWQLQSSGKFNPRQVLPGTSVTCRFAVTAAPGATQWSKHPAVAHITYVSNGNRPQTHTASTYVVITPSIYALVQRPAGKPPAYAPGTQLALTVNVRNHSLSAQSGNYTIAAPSGWQINSGSTGQFSLSAYSGGPWNNREVTRPVTVTIPSSCPAGDYAITTTWNSDNVQITSTTPITVGTA